jgi:DNA-binding HxlR family transcriptional regulator
VVIEARKSYEQFCPMATALDFVGDRWTILVLRELLGGPARFGQLRDGLPGIAPNLLADRLKRMEADGLVRRPEGTGLYTVTESGAAIRTAIEELGLWAASLGRRVAPPLHERSIRATAMALHAILVRAANRLPEDALVIELDVEGEIAEVVLGPRPSVTARPPLEPTARVAATRRWMNAYLLGEDLGGETLRHVSGDPSSTRLLEIALGLVS